MPTRRTRTTRRTTLRRTYKRSATPRRTNWRKRTRVWSREEISFMRKFYRRYETAWCARQMGRTVYSVRYKAVDLGIKKASPSVWRGNKGKPNAFKAMCKGKTRTTPTRKAVSRRSPRSRTWRATPRRRTTRRTTRRTNRKTR